MAGPARPQCFVPGPVAAVAPPGPGLSPIRVPCWRGEPHLLLCAASHVAGLGPREHHDAIPLLCPAPARLLVCVPGHLQARLAAMTSSTDSNPEDEYADDEYADHDAEDREQPSTPVDIPDDEPEEDVLEQRQEVPYREDDR